MEMENRREFLKSLCRAAAIVPGVDWLANKVKSKGVIRSVKYGTVFSSIQEWENSLDTLAVDDCEFDYIGETLGESITIPSLLRHDGTPPGSISLITSKGSKHEDRH